MEIRCGRYLLKSDPYCMWIDEEYKSTKTGKTATRRVAGYARTLDALTKDFCERRFRNNEAANMKELLKILEQTLDDVSELRKTAARKDFKIIRKGGHND